MNKTDKINYEIDPLNRLVLKSGKESLLPGFRSVLDGKFKTNRNNTLIYQVKKSSSLPKQLKLCGNYSLDKNHNLTLTLNNDSSQRSGNKLTLKTQIIDAKSDEVAFSLSTKDSAGRMRFYILKLSGKWQADKFNRLSFQVSKESGPPDTMTFCGSWQVNKNNEIVYSYTRVGLKRGIKITQTLTLSGYWKICDKYRLLYVLNKGIDSEFDFKASLGKPDKRGLKYEIGIGAAPKKKIVVIFGRWKINKQLGLIFEIPAGKNNSKKIIFGADCRLTNDYTLGLRLKNEFNRDLGIDLKLSKSILKDQGQAFLGLLKKREEFSIVAGIGLRW